MEKPINLASQRTYEDGIRDTLRELGDFVWDEDDDDPLIHLTHALARRLVSKGLITKEALDE